MEDSLGQNLTCLVLSRNAMIWIFESLPSVHKIIISLKASKYHLRDPQSVNNMLRREETTCLPLQLKVTSFLMHRHEDLSLGNVLSGHNSLLESSLKKLFPFANRNRLKKSKTNFLRSLSMAFFIRINIPSLVNNKIIYFCWIDAPSSTCLRSKVRWRCPTSNPPIFENYCLWNRCTKANQSLCLLIYEPCVKISNGPTRRGKMTIIIIIIYENKTSNWYTRDYGLGRRPA